MNANTIGMLIIMIIYLGVMVLIGVLFSRKNNDTSDFYLGGRKLGPIVTAMSAEASGLRCERFAAYGKESCSGNLTS